MPKQSVHINNEEDEELLKFVYDKTIELLKAENYFLNKNIKLTELANELSCNERQLSRAINKFGNGNFNKFINAFRIEHSKNLLISGKFDYYTIEAIADECGFSNKVSFYNAFKEVTGMSPTQYRAVKQPR